MIKELELIFKFMRPAFSRQATYYWFVICCFGFISRTDTLGVSSIIRSLFLDPVHYTSLLHFFHSTAWRADKFMLQWLKYISHHDAIHIVNGRVPLVGDNTKQPKGARHMPAVVTMHQDSETGSKPSFFRGHHWGCLGVIIKVGTKFRALPLYANIQEGVGYLIKSRKCSKTLQIVQMAIQFSNATGQNCYLILDAFFSVGPVFTEAKKTITDGVQKVHILTRAKKNITGFNPAVKIVKEKTILKNEGKPIDKKNKSKGKVSKRKDKKKCKIKKKRGAPKKYGKKIKLMSIFESKKTFKKAKAFLYKKEEQIEYLIFDLLWKPTKGMMRFILIRSSHGEIVLMTSDMELEAVTAIELYCRRMPIESLFDVLKNVMGGLNYHFWSKYLTRTSRAPIKNSKSKQKTSNLICTKNTLEATEKFVNLQLFIVGVLQIISLKYSKEVTIKANSWLRTITNIYPSEFITRIAIANVLKFNLVVFAKDWMTQLIISRSKITSEKVKMNKKAG